jgi:hypothetical protein
MDDQLIHQASSAAGEVIEYDYLRDETKPSHLKDGNNQHPVYNHDAL